MTLNSLPKHLFTKLAALMVIGAFAISTYPFQAHAADMEISGWIPYWAVSDGTKDARKHLDILTEINPFTLSVTTNGEVRDLGNMSKSTWTRLFKQAKREKVKVIPTIMWSDTAYIYAVLSDPDQREKHIDNIVEFVNKGKYDGIDIDYEGKNAATKDYFSAFLTELKRELGSKKILACTIEARTPADSLGLTGSRIAHPSNDFAVIGKVCDQVRLMTYDQQRADVKLNAKRMGEPYNPVADPEWVEKVIQLTIQTIPKQKIMLGVATYGRDWAVQVSPNWYQSYMNVSSINHEPAMEKAEDLDIEPFRNAAGELSYSYIPDRATQNLLKNVKVPSNTPTSKEAAAKALAYANQTGKTVFFNLVWWSDAKAIEDKVALAEKYDLRGISIFKIDGQEDEQIWDILEDK